MANDDTHYDKAGEAIPTELLGRIPNADEAREFLDGLALAQFS